MSVVIDSFSGPYRWLSNFAPVRIPFDGLDFPTVEHAYHAAKTFDPDWREHCANAPAFDAGSIKMLSRAVTLRADWEHVKIPIMFRLCNLKFMQQPYRWLLRGTQQAELIEGNHWNDTFWGVCNGEGQNWLGRILMSIRDYTPLEVRVPWSLDIVQLHPEHLDGMDAV